MSVGSQYAMLEEWIVLVGAVKECEARFGPVGPGVRILLVHESLMR